jgi:hypothetical protein
MSIVDVVELARRFGLPLEKHEIQGKILLRIIDVYDGVRRIRGKTYKQSIITFPAILRKTVFKRSNKFMVYLVFVNGWPALLLEPVFAPTKEDVEEFLKKLAQKNMSL